MKLTLRPEWRLWPLSSFLAVLDIKTGVTVVLLFALFNKVAGIYGIIAGATGALHSWAQGTMYLYSVIALYALYRGIMAVKDEDPKQTLYFAHFYFADHVFSTSWTIYFAVVWWLRTPHNGERPEYSPAQQQIIDGAVLSADPLPDDQRAEAAMLIWNHEKSFALTVIILSWLSKIYFILLIYSHAPTTSISANTYESALAYGEDDDGDIEDFYRAPARTPNTGNSISSFADFVNAPPSRPRRSKPSSLGRNGLGKPDDAEDEFRGHSKMGTDESSSGSRTSDERNIRA
ncbi:Inositolphosphorylceramide synthase subunit Kei1-domain-containing protein [Mucidula mucida]|nr:Inositolphosphorylceramide synthase subunit Kei1-domain-containing protein [Mucidula mucida]